MTGQDGDGAGVGGRDRTSARLHDEAGEEERVAAGLDPALGYAGDGVLMGVPPLAVQSGLEPASPLPEDDLPQPRSSIVHSADPAAYRSNKPLAEIEEDIARTRADLSETLDALEEKLAPRHLIEKGVDMIRDSMNENFGRVTGTVGDTVRAHPISLALIGAGISWLALSQTGGTRRLSEAAAPLGRSVRDSLAAATARAGEYAETLTERVKDAAGHLVSSGESAGPSDPNYAYARPKTEGIDRRGYRAGKVAAAGSAAYRQAGDYASRAGEQLGTLRDRVADAMEDHPLAVGALAVLAGATVAMLLPATRMEDGYLGETRDRLLDEAQGLGNRAIGKAGDIAEAAVDAAGDAVRREIS